MTSRADVLADAALRGRGLCAALTDATDDWLEAVFGDACNGDQAGLAVVAVGGYGRGELSPASDLDLVLVHDGRRTDVAEVAERLWYPIWDEGVKLGHAVRTVKECLSLASSDLDTATSFLSIRCLSGADDLAAEVASKAADQWRRRAKRWLPEMATAVEDRHARFGEVAFHLEPDLKEGRGGLRDVHALGWAEAAHDLLLPGDASSLSAAYDDLLDARVELHRRAERPGDVLHLQEQDAVAEALGDDSADLLMARLSSAARTIAWTSDEAWIRIGSSLKGPLGRVARRDKPVGVGIVMRDGEVHLTADADPRTDAALVVRAAAAAAAHDTRIARGSLDRLAAEAAPMPDPWPDDARDAFVTLLGAGTPAIAVVEGLDQRGLLTNLLPEWEPCRSKPQRNAYHRFTVDRHLIEAAVEASALVDSVERPDLLLVGALLHDIGKGYPGDHTEVGMDLVRAIGTRMGFADADVATLVVMVEHHLLLPDVATRRDLADEGTTDLVAGAVGDVERLRLLAALTEADSVATGPAAWGGWKAGLVRELVARTEHVLGGGESHEAVAHEFPTADQEALLRRGESTVTGIDDVLTVVTRDRPGVFSRVAGVLALHGLGVLEADATSENGMALSVLRVESAFGPTISWEKVAADVQKALTGRLALHSRLAERAKVYDRTVPTGAHPYATEVRFDNEVSDAATVIEVQTEDRAGLLFRMTEAMADLDLDIRTARAQTMIHTVVDSFYVVDAAGAKITDPRHQAEIRRAVTHAVDG